MVRSSNITQKREMKLKGPKLRGADWGSQKVRKGAKPDMAPWRCQMVRSSTVSEKRKGAEGTGTAEGRLRCQKVRMRVKPHISRKTAKRRVKSRKRKKRFGKLTSDENISQLSDKLVQPVGRGEMDPKTGIVGEMWRTVVDGRINRSQVESIQPMPKVESIGGVTNVVRRQGSRGGRREGQRKRPSVTAHPEKF